MPLQHDGENAANLSEWEPRVRGKLFDFELVSRLGFSVVLRRRGRRRRRPRRSRTVTESGAVDRRVAARRSRLSSPLIRFDRPSEAVFRTQLQYHDAPMPTCAPTARRRSWPRRGSIVPFMASIGFLRPDAKRWTMELLEAVLQLARYVEQRVKHGLACRRPNEYSAQVQPIILTPGHGSLPSGHATEAFAVARVFCGLLRTGAIAPRNPNTAALSGSGLRQAADAPRGAHRDQPHGGRRALPDRQRRRGAARPDARRLFPRPRPATRTPTRRRISTGPRRTSATWISTWQTVYDVEVHR